MSSGVSSDAGGESKTAAKGDEGRAGYIVHPGGDAVPKKVIWGQPSQCVPAEINGRAPARFASNVVITSKYTALNFTPLFLFEQFQRVANIYFIFVSLFEFNFFGLESYNFPVSLLSRSPVRFQG